MISMSAFLLCIIFIYTKMMQLFVLTGSYTHDNINVADECLSYREVVIA